MTHKTKAIILLQINIARVIFLESEKWIYSKTIPIAFLLIFFFYLPLRQ